MNIQCNGENRTVDAGATLMDLVTAMDLEPKTMVAEVNGTIIEHSAFGERTLKEGDRVELIRFVGGG